MKKARASFSERKPAGKRERERERERERVAISENGTVGEFKVIDNDGCEKEMDINLGPIIHV
jgi:hypothetical protein